MPSSLSRFVVLSFAVLVLTSLVLAQGSATGAITGTVQDPSGAIVANADVRITNQDTNKVERTLTTGVDGTFTAPLLPVGTYSVTIRSKGFAERTLGDIVVRVTETTRINQDTNEVERTCVNNLGVAGLTGNAAGSTFRNSVSTGWGPRVGFAWDAFGQLFPQVFNRQLFFTATSPTTTDFDNFVQGTLGRRENCEHHGQSAADSVFVALGVLVGGSLRLDDCGDSFTL